MEECPTSLHEGHRHHSKFGAMTYLVETGKGRLALHFELGWH